VLYKAPEWGWRKEGHLVLKSCHFLQNFDTVGLTRVADITCVKENKAEPIGILQYFVTVG